MKKIMILTVSALAMLFAASCQKTIVNNTKGDGYLSFSGLSITTDETVITKAEEEADGNYSITILDSEGIEVTTKSYSEVMNSNNKISLPAGSYTLVAKSSQSAIPASTFNNRAVYGTSKDFTIAAGEVTEIGELVCTLLQCMVSVSYSDEFLATVTGAGSTTVTITAGSGLEYVLNANRTYETRPGYFAVDGNTMEVVFKGQINGKSQKMTKIFTGIAARQWRHIKFVQKTNEQGDATFDIVIDDLVSDAPLNEDISGIVGEGGEGSLGADPEQPKGDGGIALFPNYSEADAAYNVIVVEEDEVDPTDANRKIGVLTIPISNPEDGAMKMYLKASVPGGVKKFTVDISTDNNAFAAAVAAADATHLNLISPSEANAVIFTVVPFPHGSELLGMTEVDFDLSAAHNPIYNYKGNHTFHMTVTDNAGCSKSFKVTMIVE